MRFYIGHRVGGFWTGIGIGRYRWRRAPALRRRKIVLRTYNPWPWIAGLVAFAAILYYWYVTVPLAVLIALVWWVAERKRR